ncbi:MAG: alpha/beta fold hydrolase [Planctomycetota bacterium]|nr:alpha/beta fold hydrolase [Planctomycetota bacterium]
MVDTPFEIASFVTSGGYKLHYRHFQPVGISKGTIVFIHGIQSHGGWYETSCKKFAQAGYRVLFLDRRGSGLNEVSRGDSPSFRTLLDDLKEFLQHQRKEITGSTPLILGAISWGGKIAFGLEIRIANLVDGFILLAPGFCPKIQPTRKERFFIALGSLFSPRRLFNIPLNDPDLFTSNPVAQKFLKEDPFALRKATARFLLDSVRLDFYLRIFRTKISKPILLLIAGQDKIIDNEKTIAFVKRFSSGSLTIIEYPKAHHTFEFEPEPQKHIEEIEEWLQAQFKK